MEPAHTGSHGASPPTGLDAGRTAALRSPVGLLHAAGGGVAPETTSAAWELALSERHITC
jgi:hypothetical protein